MISQLFLGLSLLGASWVLYLLILLSILSVSIMIERWRTYSQATCGLEEFRSQIKNSLQKNQIAEALSLSQKRSIQFEKQAADLETEMTYTLLQHAQQSRTSIESLNEAAQEGILKAKIKWENHLSTLATIGNNAPFIGLFGTVLGIIQAFHDLSKQASGQAAGVGASSVTAGISEALIATAVGILVAIPAVMAYNYFTRKLKIHLTMAEAQKSYLISVLSSQKS